MSGRDEEMVDVDAKLIDESDAAWFISDGFSRAWIPKSKCTDNGDGTFSMPEWIAKDKGLI